jgi:hypothetical protein
MRDALATVDSSCRSVAASSIGDRLWVARRGIAAALTLAVGSAALAMPTAALAQGKPAAPAASGSAAPYKAVAKPADKKATAAPPAAKKGDKKAAGAAFKKGKELFEKKDFAGAKEQFQKAEEILPGAAPKYWLGRVAEETGDDVVAAAFYKAALDVNDEKFKDKDDAKKRGDTLGAKPRKLTITSDPPGAAVSVDGIAQAGKVTPVDIELPPGKHKISLSAAGRKNVDKDVDVLPLVTGTLDLKLEIAPAAEPAEDPFKAKPATPPPAATPPATPVATTTTTTAPAKRDLTWVWVTGGAAIVAIGVGSAFGVLALGKHSDYNNATSTTPTPDPAKARSIRDDGTRDALIADMGFGIGVTLAVTSIVLWATSPSGEEKASAKRSQFAISPMIGAPTSHGAPSIAGASASFHF